MIKIIKEIMLFQNLVQHARLVKFKISFMVAQVPDSGYLENI